MRNTSASLAIAKYDSIDAGDGQPIDPGLIEKETLAMEETNDWHVLYEDSVRLLPKFHSPSLIELRHGRPGQTVELRDVVLREVDWCSGHEHGHKEILVVRVICEPAKRGHLELSGANDPLAIDHGIDRIKSDIHSKVLLGLRLYELGHHGLVTDGNMDQAYGGKSLPAREAHFGHDLSGS